MTPTLPFVISVLAFATCVLLMYGGYLVVRSKKMAKEVEGRFAIKSSRNATSAGGQNGRELEWAYLKNVALQAIERLGQLNKPKDEMSLSMLRKSLVTAGFRKPSAPVMFTGTKVVMAILHGIGFFLFGAELTKGFDPSYYPLFLVGAALMGFYVPNVWLHKRIASRKEKILDGFPDSLDLMVVCVEAGLGLDAAIARVGKEIQSAHKELGEEFQLLGLELRAGLTREQALRNFAQRTELEEIRGLVALLVQTDRFGTSVSQALRVHSDSMRTARRQRAEEAAAKMAVKMMLPLMLFIFPCLFVVLLGPAAIKIMRTLLPALASTGN